MCRAVFRPPQTLMPVSCHCTTRPRHCIRHDHSFERPYYAAVLKEHQMSLFLSRCPLWFAAILVVVLPTIAAMYGPALIRRRVALERLTIHNEIAGFKFATVGVLYAVLVAFAIIMVWERFADAESAVAQEAGAATTLYRLASGSDPDAVEMRRTLDNYLALAIERDWPQMALEGE